MDPLHAKPLQELQEINVLASIGNTPSTSCRKLEENIGVPKSRVQEILHKYKFQPYKFKLVQNLHPGDDQRRLHFSHWYLQNLNIDLNFHSKVIWSDEAFITSAGILNRHNSRHWSKENPHMIYPREQQGRFGFSVGVFILGSKFKYHIYEGSLTANRYLHILENPLAELYDDVPLAQLNQIYFQQDGAPAHNAQLIRTYLDANFPGRWIGTHGPIRWPPRSPDLSVLDFFFWGYLENKIYSTNHRTMEDLRNATEQEFRNLQGRPLILLNALRRIGKVCHKCIEHNGLQFEQYP